MWLYHVFSLSLRDVELILAERGIVVTHESIRHWCLKFGSDFARKLRRRRPQPGDTWHLDEVFIRIRGVLHYLWRAVDQHGVVLDILVQDRRNGAAAKRFFKHLLHGLQYKPRRLVTDGLRSYGVAQLRSCPMFGIGRVGLEQSSREFASTHSTTRTTYAEVQISQPGTAVSVGACDDLRSLPAAAPSHGRSRLSTRSREGVPDLATGNLRPSSSVMARYRPPIARTRLRIG